MTSNAFSSCYVNFSGFWFESLAVNSDHSDLKELLIRTQKHVIKKYFNQTIEEREIIKQYTETSMARRYKSNSFI